MKVAKRNKIEDEREACCPESWSQYYYFEVVCFFAGAKICWQL